jgi:ABC-type nickel/cobalt efflux system permease component RcnA
MIIGIDFRKYIFSTLMLLLVASGIMAQTAPAPPPPPGTPEVIDSEVRIRTNLRGWFNEVQARGTAFLKKQLDILKLNINLKAILVIVLFSLVFGVFHTLGPGHGKLVIISYFLNEETSKFDAIVLSIIVSLIHSSGAILMALLFQSLLSSVKGLARLKFQYGFTIFSGILIFLMGIYFLAGRIKRYRGRNDSNTDKFTYRSDKGKVQNRWMRNILAGFSIGIVPCPFSLTLMMISIVYGIFWVGVLSVISLTIAMVLVLYILSISTIKSREVLEKKKLQKKESFFLKSITPVLGFTGISVMILLGISFIYRGVSALLSFS